jgi:hypothetical protein
MLAEDAYQSENVTDKSMFFRIEDNRQFNNMSDVYMLPSDEEEVKVSCNLIFFNCLLCHVEHFGWCSGQHTIIT